MLASALLVTLAALPAGPVEPGFTADNISEGVYLMRAAEEREDLVNSLLVERQDGLLVINAQPTPAAAHELLQAIGKISSEPVRYVVYTKPQSDAVGGATAFPRSALIIASDDCAAALDDLQYDFSLEARLRAGDPEEWTPPERRLPTLRLTAQADLDDPLNSVRLMPIGPAQTTGDMLVLLPREKILFAGTLVPIDRNPFAADASASGWLMALNRIAKMAPSLVLPARGAGIETRIVRERRDAIAWLRGQVEREFQEKIHPARMPERIVLVPEAAKYFDLEADPSFIAGLIERVVADAIQERRKRGTWTD